MYCGQCGKRVLDDMLFCPFCGSPIVIPEQDEPAPPPRRNPAPKAAVKRAPAEATVECALVEETVERVPVEAVLEDAMPEGEASSAPNSEAAAATGSEPEPAPEADVPPEPTSAQEEMPDNAPEPAPEPEAEPEQEMEPAPEAAQGAREEPPAPRPDEAPAPRPDEAKPASPERPVSLFDVYDDADDSENADDSEPADASDDLDDFEDADDSENMDDFEDLDDFEDADDSDGWDFFDEEDPFDDMDDFDEEDFDDDADDYDDLDASDEDGEPFSPLEIGDVTDPGEEEDFEPVRRDPPPRSAPRRLAPAGRGRRASKTFIPVRDVDPDDMFMSRIHPLPDDPDPFDEDVAPRRSKRARQEDFSFEDAEPDSFLQRHIRGVVGLLLLAMLLVIFLAWAVLPMGQRVLASANLAWNPQVYNELGNEAYEAGRYTQAAECFERAFARDSGNYDYAHSAMVAYYEAGDLDDSLAMLKRCIDMAPDDPEPYGELMILYPDAASRPWEVQQLLRQGYERTGAASLREDGA